MCGLDLKDRILDDQEDIRLDEGDEIDITKVKSYHKSYSSSTNYDIAESSNTRYSSLSTGYEVAGLSNPSSHFTIRDSFDETIILSFDSSDILIRKEYA